MAGRGILTTGILRDFPLPTFLAVLFPATDAVLVPVDQQVTDTSDGDSSNDRDLMHLQVDDDDVEGAERQRWRGLECQ